MTYPAVHDKLCNVSHFVRFVFLILMLQTILNKQDLVTLVLQHPSLLTAPRAGGAQHASGLGCRNVGRKGHVGPPGCLGPVRPWGGSGQLGGYTGRMVTMASGTLLLLLFSTTQHGCNLGTRS